ncbi:MAG: Lrp/AsnC family transcriptional regulator [Pseudomonadota bacterium]|uniref:Lrp/AsnC family transcriptional regulator n=1 Tax=unclassified Halomonas TaxID=2609666 RepID=UPI001C971ADF|nr:MULTISPECIES: Lrp/AsnC family transcriptional regulator [unclassified Halomonas]MED5295335.1 Lrp/AsnC family transcriptional regulator [Pseudomonadota bacterium]MBY5928118.1 Lrp/AsnC family transcriptional regulator [Halomonas sp. DP8Y7-3]MBY5982837.1 Lrp/AsnC family transcriptional regulator [Halomonas sp. DP5Y7-2]MBY6029159.1 Lrp/AsnC family transcriptional regulator [Halomonas sp. DP8Y7-1]MEE3216546.1 Lrp/AsnC family transcriptional regulator [Pseudomonadota bacterium]
MKLDRYDLKILSILSQDGRITKSRLAEAINLSVSPCWERVRRLEKAGVIEGYCARINAAALVRRTPVWVQIELKAHNAESFQRFEALVHATDEVTECVAVGGGVDYLIKVETETIDAYQRLIDDWLTSDIGIERYFTYIVTKQVKAPRQGVDIDALNSSAT